MANARTSLSFWRGKREEGMPSSVFNLRRFATLMGTTAVLLSATPAYAYVGPSFLQIGGVTGGWKGAQYRNWIHVRANYWATEPLKVDGNNRRERLRFYPISDAPRGGASSLTIAIEKRSPAYRSLMKACGTKVVLPDLKFAESSEYIKDGYQLGDRPPAIPEFFEYRLAGARITDCPIVDGAPEQAFVISFGNIEWLNFTPTDADIPSVFRPSGIVPQKESKTTKSFVLTWFAAANDVGIDQCAVMAKKTPEEEYYRYMSPQEATKERASFAAKGGVSYSSNQMSLRGPGRLNVPRLPGIVPAPVQPMPNTNLARGLDLDGRGATAAASGKNARHVNFGTSDGRVGIDNQLYAVQGCVEGLLGRRGYTPRFSNAMMRDGEYSIILQLTGVDDLKNDDSVDLTWFYSSDPMTKSASGGAIVADYTFRVSDNPQHTHYFKRLHGRIKDGILETDPVDKLSVNMGRFGFPSEKRFYSARLRLELLPDGGIKGVLGSYMDVWSVQSFGSSQGEQQLGYDSSALYNAIVQHADASSDKASGEYDRISTAFDVEGVSAFLAGSEDN